MIWLLAVAGLLLAVLALTGWLSARWLVQTHPQDNNYPGEERRK
jgi:hypothetical protein